MINLLSFLGILGFSPKDGADRIYSKSYKGYEIKVNYNELNPKKSEIDYGIKILCNRKTTCNFHQEETFVVLECVNRLLEKDYKPENIELEKSWGMGHTEGYLDILVKDEQNNSFAMIECKTWGREYDKYVKETFTHKNKGKENDGGQVFTYLQQEPKTTKAICYYTSHISGKGFEYKNAIIHNKEDWSELNQVERFNRWSKTFETNGIFEDDIPLYKIESKAIRRKDLKELRREDSEGIYNQFAEILRHNVVSDKPNAFNKIINMFLCKIWDEDNTATNQEVKFQTRTLGRDKTNEELLEDLNDLYKAGMNAYLEKDVSDVTKDDFEILLNFVNTPSKKNEFEELYKTLRLYKNNEFAFKEVFDKKSFKDNAKVVREVVELLQDKQLRYSHKQQFLGDFFEKLLNDSIKQEAGQFFTPVPLTQFIIKSLPIKEIIQNKIKNNEADTLPYVIDYACGTGHFLTEIMDNIDKIIKEDIDIESITRPAVMREFKIWKDSEFEWAEKYIYGIDLDYRLIKASKISCFLNGDGKANLLHANGLAPFNSEDYIGKLHSNTDKQDNQQFDILIANPPYSVKAFKPTVKEGDKLFELFSNFSESSSEIECLFVERAKQLIKEGGYAGIVLPVSLLTNDKVYIKTREIILKYFDIKGILALQDNAFMATGTKTIILLMQRRSNTYWEQINFAVKSFFENYRDVTVSGIEKAFSKFVETNYEDLAFEDYVSILKNNPSENAQKSEFYEEHKSLSNDALKALEQDKMLYFFLAYNSKLVLANSGEKAEEKQFLGYEFSNRRGQEGINIYKDDDGHILSNLFSDIDNFDNDKLNSFIYRNFINENIEKRILDINLLEEHPLKNHIDYCRLSELIDFSLPKFEKVINLNSKKKLKFESKYKSIKIKRVEELEIIKGTSITEKETVKGEVPVIAGGIYPAYYHNEANRKGDIITISASGANAGYVNYFDIPIWASDCSTITSKNPKKVNVKYVYELLKSKQKDIYYSQKGKSQPHVYPEDIVEFKLPFPDVDIQEKIVEEMLPLSKSEKEAVAEIKNKTTNIEQMYISLYGNAKKSIRLSDKGVFELSIGKRVLNKELLKLGKIPVFSANVFEPFGYFDKLLITDFSKKSVLWGIDGDWMVNTIEENIPFYPTDHCGILRLKDNSKLLENYVAYALKKLGAEYGFSRSKRASIDRIETIKIPIPDIDEQKKIVAQVLPLEAEVKKLQKEIDKIPAKKQAILDKYLK